MKKKLFITGSTGIPARYGGFETFAENISRQLSKYFDVTVICSSHYYTSEERSPVWNSVKRIFIDKVPNGIQSILYDIKGLSLSVKGQADYILQLGTGCGIFLPFIRGLRKTRLFIHVDGIEWKRPKWNFIAKTFLRAGHLVGTYKADLILIDNTAILDEIPRVFHKKTITVNYGGDHLPLKKDSHETDKTDYSLVIARAEPENNLEMILSVFSKLKQKKLILISNWDKTSYGRRLFRVYCSHPNITMLKAIYDNRLLLHQYRTNAFCYIHGHSAGGTNPSLVEAMYTGIPVIAFDNEFNRITTHNAAFYFNTVSQIENILTNSNYSSFAESAEKLKKYATKNYLWQNAVNKIMEAVKGFEKKETEV